MVTSSDQVSEFLYYGYLPSSSRWSARTQHVRHLSHALSRVKPLAYDWPAHKWVEHGVVVLRDALARQPLDQGRCHIVPISGGYDSRLLLSWVSRNVPRENVVAVTFGTPGTFDFEIGRKVAQVAGVQHDALDLTTVRLSRNELIQAVCDGGEWTYLPDAFYNRLIHNTYGDDVVYWSGYLGEAVAGAHLAPLSANDWSAARLHFADRQRWSRAVDITMPGYNPLEPLPDVPLFSVEAVSPYEQLDIMFRQVACIRPILDSGNREIRMPFTDREWIRFMMGAPRSLREGTRLYFDVLERFDPVLFSLPAKQHYGLPRAAGIWRINTRRAKLRLARAGQQMLPQLPWPVSPMVNYIDLNAALRKRSDIREVVLQSLENLQRAGVVDWLAPMRLWQQHQDHRIDCAAALLALTALDLNLQVQELC